MTSWTQPGRLTVFYCFHVCLYFHVFYPFVFLVFWQYLLSSSYGKDLTLAVLLWCRAPSQLDVDNSVGGAAERASPSSAELARPELQMAAAALTARRPFLKCPAQEHSLLRLPVFLVSVRSLPCVLVISIWAVKPAAVRRNPVIGLVFRWGPFLVRELVGKSVTHSLERAPAPRVILPPACIKQQWSIVRDKLLILLLLLLAKMVKTHFYPFERFPLLSLCCASWTQRPNIAGFCAEEMVALQQSVYLPPCRPLFGLDDLFLTHIFWPFCEIFLTGYLDQIVIVQWPIQRFLKNIFLCDRWSSLSVLLKL